MQRRCLHIASSLPFIEGTGVGQFLSPKSLNLLKQIQGENLSSLNQSLQGTPQEQLSIYQLLQRTHSDANQANVFATASQVWNMDFFLQGLSPALMAKTDKLEEAIESSFGSFAKFQYLFATYAESMVGPGYIWLMHKKASEGPGRLSIQCTFGTGSPLFNAVVPPTFHSGRPSSSPAPIPNPSTGLFASFSFTSLVSDGKNHAKPHPSHEKPIEPIINNKIMPVAPQSIDTRVPTDTDKPLPVLGLNLWEHAYLLDFTTSKKQYINQFWSAVNWNRVAVMLNLY